MLFAALSCSSYLAAQANTRLPMATFNQLAARCAPNAAVDTLDAVALTESALHPYALSLNYPATVAAYNGLHNQEVYLTRQPATLPEAIHWTRWFHSRGYTVSIGLMQINSENAARYGVAVRQLFDPCTNVAIGARLLGEIYSTTPHSGKPDINALFSTFSAYNSGYIYNWIEERLCVYSYEQRSSRSWELASLVVDKNESPAFANAGPVLHPHRRRAPFG